MHEPDLSALTAQQHATYLTGALVRNDLLLEVTTRSILRSLGRRHPADPVPDEPAAFLALLDATAAAVRATPDLPLADDMLDALSSAADAHRASTELVHRMWGQQEGSDVFQLLDLLPTSSESRAPAIDLPEDEVDAVRRAQARAYVRLGGVEKSVRHAAYEAPFDTADAASTRIAQLRGEFELRDDGTMELATAE